MNKVYPFWMRVQNSALESNLVILRHHWHLATTAARQIRCIAVRLELGNVVVMQLLLHVQGNAADELPESLLGTMRLVQVRL